MLEYLLGRLEDLSSIDGVYLITNNRFAGHFENWAAGLRYPWPIEVVDDGTRSNETRLGAIGDLGFALRRFKIRDDLAVFAGDNLFGSPLDGFIKFACSHRPHASIGVVEVGDRERARSFGIVRLEEEGRVIQFLEKPKNPPSTLASTGAYWFAREGLELLDRYLGEGHNADRPGDYIAWLVQVDRVFAYPFEGRWFDIGSLDSYREADRYFHSLKEKGKKQGKP